MEHLDRYEGEGLDDGFLEDVTLEEQMAGRRAAELALERRDAAEGRLTGRRRVRPAALEGAQGAGWGRGGGNTQQRRRRALPPPRPAGPSFSAESRGLHRWLQLGLGPPSNSAPPPSSNLSLAPSLPLPPLSPCRGAG